MSESKYIAKVCGSPAFTEILQKTVKKLGGDVSSIQDSFNISLPKEKESEFWKVFDTIAEEVLSKN